MTEENHITETPTSTAPVVYPIIAKPGSYYRNVRYVLTVAAIAAGAWFGYDGWVNWPAQNAEYDRLEQQYRDSSGADDKSFKAAVDEKGLKKRSETDLTIQKILAITLPLAGLGLLVSMLYKSRGEYRYDGKTLYVPGHPPIDVDSISRIDRAKWDRKGIAFFDYATANGGIGRAKLDDFLYEREPTDKIFDLIAEKFESPSVE